jgi:hypothetical protein
VPRYADVRDDNLLEPIHQEVQIPLVLPRKRGAAAFEPGTENDRRLRYEIVLLHADKRSGHDRRTITLAVGCVGGEHCLGGQRPLCPGDRDQSLELEQTLPAGGRIGEPERDRIPGDLWVVEGYAVHQAAALPVFRTLGQHDGDAEVPRRDR